MIEMCQKKKIIVGNIWFMKRRKIKYDWERENPRGKALTDYVFEIERELGG